MRRGRRPAVYDPTRPGSEALKDRISGGAPQGAAGFLRPYFPNRSNFGKLRVIRVPASAR